MTIGLLFWILFIVGTVFRLYHLRLSTPPMWDFEVPYWILILLLGIGVFGYPIR